MSYSYQVEAVIVLSFYIYDYNVISGKHCIRVHLFIQYIYYNISSLLSCYYYVIYKTIIWLGSNRIN